jgi:hypothetical protein
MGLCVRVLYSPLKSKARYWVSHLFLPSQALLSLGVYILVIFRISALLVSIAHARKIYVTEYYTG